MNRRPRTPSPLLRQGPCNWLFILFFICSPCCSLHVGLLTTGSPVLLVIFLLHVALSITSLALNPVLFQVSLDCIFASYFRSSSLPVPWYMSALNTFLSMCSSALLTTCPCQFNIRSVIFLEACTALVVRTARCSSNLFVPDIVFACYSVGLHPP